MKLSVINTLRAALYIEEYNRRDAAPKMAPVVFIENASP
ncbi:hypothetical protein FHT77_001346 [Rhizobium sp. BK181]|nr:hypothetical protein [Rhizobium sp. BK181]